MTKKNSTSDLPFLLAPIGKDYLWGGSKLKQDFHKGFISCSPLAETWECSTHPAGLSKLRTSDGSEKSFLDFLTENAEVLCNPGHRVLFPVLLKLIDAKENLSLQVHPSDEEATVYEEGQKGKTEFWYILDAEPGAFIYLGFKSSCHQETIRKLVENGELESVLNKVYVQKGDSFLIQPGTVHAIGKGIVLAEIQENSNLTYRLYDYGRRDADGNLRELHIEKALRVIDFSCTDKVKRRIKTIKYEPGIRKERLVQCDYFIADVWRIEEGVLLPRTTNQNCIVLCVEGSGFLEKTNRQKIFSFRKGDCFFMPKSDEQFHLVGKFEIVIVGI